MLLKPTLQATYHSFSVFWLFFLSEEEVWGYHLSIKEHLCQIFKLLSSKREQVAGDQGEGGRGHEQLVQRPIFNCTLASSGGSLQDVLLENSKTASYFKETELKEILLQVSMGLKYIHISGLVHMDIKPSKHTCLNPLSDSFLHLILPWALPCRMYVQDTRG